MSAKKRIICLQNEKGDIIDALIFISSNDIINICFMDIIYSECSIFGNDISIKVEYTGLNDYIITITFKGSSILCHTNLRNGIFNKLDTLRILDKQAVKIETLYY